MGGPAARGFPFGKFARQRGRTGVVKAHAIDHALVGDGAEHAWRRIAWLRVPGHPAKFHKAEAQLFPARHGGCELVHAGGQPHGIGEWQTKQLNRQRRCREKRFHQQTGEGMLGRKGESRHSVIVGAFGILPEEQGTEEFFMQQTHEQSRIKASSAQGNVFSRSEWIWHMAKVTIQAG